MEQTDSDQRGASKGIMIEGERTRQRTCMNDPLTWTTVWGLTVEAGGGLVRGGQRGKNWNNYKRITIKMIFLNGDF